jgi:serine protease
MFALNVQPAKASNDPLFPAQWALQQIGAPTAWHRSTGAGVRVGIVDSGVFAAQEDLAGKVVAATDCINTGGDPSACHGDGRDDTGHGTDMAGIIAATKGNGRGMAGVAPGAQLVVARALTDNGGKILDVEAGIRWVVQHGARVVNLSLGDNPLAQSPIDLSFEAAVEEAWAAGAVPVVTSGNTTALGPMREDFAHLDALVVGATDAQGVVTPYSNPLGAAKWGIVAPGGSGTRDGRDVISAWWDGKAPGATNLYSYGAGASVAAAHASGVVALLLAQGLTPSEAVERIVNTARPASCGPGCHGLLDAAAATALTAPPIVINAAPAAAPAPVLPQASRSGPTSARLQPSPTSPVTEPATSQPDQARAGLTPGDGAGTVAKVVSIGGAFTHWWMPTWAAMSLLIGVTALHFLRRRAVPTAAGGEDAHDIAGA